MTEEEKALAGYLYDAQEESLGKERLRSQELSFDYNSLRPSQTAEREAIIRREMKKTGKKFRIEAPFYCVFLGKGDSGRELFSNYNFVLLAGNEVTFGDDVRIGPNCGIMRQATRLTRKEERRELSMPVRYISGIMSGSAVMCRSSQALPSGIIRS